MPDTFVCCNEDGSTFVKADKSTHSFRVDVHICVPAYYASVFEIWACFFGPASVKLVWRLQTHTLSPADYTWMPRSSPLKRRSARTGPTGCTVILAWNEKVYSVQVNRCSSYHGEWIFEELRKHLQSKNILLLFWILELLIGEFLSPPVSGRPLVFYFKAEFQSEEQNRLISLCIVWRTNKAPEKRLLRFANRKKRMTWPTDYIYLL